MIEWTPGLLLALVEWCSRVHPDNSCIFVNCSGVRSARWLAGASSSPLSRDDELALEAHVDEWVAALRMLKLVRLQWCGGNPDTDFIDLVVTERGQNLVRDLHLDVELALAVSLDG